MANNSGQKPRGYGRQDQREMKPADLAKLGNYIKTPYSEDGKYDARFIVDYAKRVSDMLTGRGYLVGRDENKSSQIRKYFEFSRRVETALKSGQMDFDAALLELNSLRYQASYASERGKVSQCFVDFIETNLDKIGCASDLYFFVKHFEAVVGYSKERK